MFLLELVELAPGEGIFLDAGIPHAYLQGAGIEVMANSDNVLRAGLTPKHVDPPELLRILRCDAPAVPRIRPDAEGVYRTPAMEFELCVRTLGPDAPSGWRASGPEVLLRAPGPGPTGDGRRQLHGARGRRRCHGGGGRPGCVSPARMPPCTGSGWLRADEERESAMHIDLLDPASFAGGQPHDQFRWLREHAPALPASGAGWSGLPGPDPLGRCPRGRSRSGDLLLRTHDHDPATRNRGSGMDFTGDHKMMLMMDPPLHTEYRKLISREFTQGPAREMQPWIADFARQIVDAGDRSRSPATSSPRWPARCPASSSPG
ncbi:MAG: hypothetical protein U5R48_18065 [Gammaproteobacteria bacterium]|nr:hypothetical protein [Gammaproteobacteria bacterium]